MGQRAAPRVKRELLNSGRRRRRSGTATTTTGSRAYTALACVRWRLSTTTTTTTCFLLPFRRFTAAYTAPLYTRYITAAACHLLYVYYTFFFFFLWHCNTCAFSVLPARALTRSQPYIYRRNQRDPGRGTMVRAIPFHRVYRPRSRLLLFLRRSSPSPPTGSAKLAYTGGLTATTATYG